MRSMTHAVALALLALAFALAAPSQTDETAPTTTETVETPALSFVTWSDRHRGIAIRYPGSWTLRPGRRDCFALATPDGAEVRVGEGRGTERVVAREHGRRIHADVTLGPEVPEATGEAIQTALASVRLKRSGRCGLVHQPIRWRQSTALGTPGSGRLVNGVQLPAEGMHFFTWDPVLRQSPNRPWRRWGTDGLVRTTLRIINVFAARHPDAPRVGIGDLSRPHGGDFGPKHATHTNGLDVDVYYPRKDGLERPPRRPSQVDRRLAQVLVDLFVAAGASRIYVGPNVDLTGPPGIVRAIWNHDNHLHARIPRWRS
jgi:penicillin-insensitive murein endopeptidase